MEVTEFIKKNKEMVLYFSFLLVATILSVYSLVSIHIYLIFSMLLKFVSVFCLIRIWKKYYSEGKK